MDCWGMFRWGVAGGVVGVLHPILWIAACSGLTGCGGSKCCPIMSSCLLLVLLFRSLIFFSVLKMSAVQYITVILMSLNIDMGSLDQSYDSTNMGARNNRVNHLSN